MTHRGLIATRVQKVNLFTLTYGNRARERERRESNPASASGTTSRYPANIASDTTLLQEEETSQSAGAGGVGDATRVWAELDTADVYIAWRARRRRRVVVVV